MSGKINHIKTRPEREQEKVRQDILKMLDEVRDRVIQGETIDLFVMEGSVKQYAYDWKGWNKPELTAFLYRTLTEITQEWIGSISREHENLDAEVVSLQKGCDNKACHDEPYPESDMYTKIIVETFDNMLTMEKEMHIECNGELIADLPSGTLLSQDGIIRLLNKYRENGELPLTRKQALEALDNT